MVNTATYCFYLFLLLELLRRVIPFVFFNDEGFFNMLKKGAFKVARKLPYVGEKVKFRRNCNFEISSKMRLSTQTCFIRLDVSNLYPPEKASWPEMGQLFLIFIRYGNYFLYP